MCVYGEKKLLLNTKCCQIGEKKKRKKRNDNDRKKKNNEFDRCQSEEILITNMFFSPNATRAFFSHTQSAHCPVKKTATGVERIDRVCMLRIPWNIKICVTCERFSNV